jgi:hypothetical protein
MEVVKMQRMRKRVEIYSDLIGTMLDQKDFSFHRKDLSAYARSLDDCSFIVMGKHVTLFSPVCMI